MTISSAPEELQIAANLFIEPVNVSTDAKNTYTKRINVTIDDTQRSPAERTKSRRNCLQVLPALTDESDDTAI